ncbi:caspase, EACC1-associated type [Longispora urticae]
MGRRLALLIATYEYEDAGLRKLVSPPHDAEAFAAVLSDPEIAGFEVTTLINESHGTVGRAISDLYRDRLGDDLTLLYYTGHGLKDDDGQLYLAMADTRRDNLDFTGLSTERIGRVLSRCASRQKVLILDCCYSGAYRLDLAKSDAGVHTMDRFRGRGLTVLTASDAMQYSFEGDKVHGEAAPSVFTGHMVAGIRDGGADLDGDGDITLGELYDYVYDRVVAETPHQRPKKKDDTEGRTVLARNVHWQLPRHVANLITSPLPSARLDGLRLLDQLNSGGNELVRARVLTELLRLADDDSRMVSDAAASSLPRLRALDGSPAAPTHRPPAGPTVTGQDPFADDTRAAERAEAAGRGRAAELVRHAQAEAQDILDRAKSQVDDILAGAATDARAFLEASRRDVEALRGTVRAEVEQLRRELADAERRRDAALADAKGAEAVRDTALAAAAAVEERRGAAPAEVEAAEAHQADRITMLTDRSLTSHTKAVYSATFHPQGHVFATAGEDNVVLMWSSYTGSLERSLGHPAAVYAVAVSPSGHLFATGGFDHKVRLWRPETSGCLTELGGHDAAVSAVAFHPEGDLLASASLDGTVRLWDPRTGEQVGSALTGHGGPVAAVAFHPQGHLMATGGQDHQVQLWDPSMKRTVGAPLTGHDGAVRTVAFHPGGRLLATAGSDESVRLWDVHTGRLVGRPLTGHTGTVHSIAFHPGGDVMASAGADRTVRLWDLHTGQQLRRSYKGHPGPVYTVAFHPSGHYLVSGGDVGEVKLWSIRFRGALSPGDFVRNLPGNSDADGAAARRFTLAPTAENTSGPASHPPPASAYQATSEAITWLSDRIRAPGVEPILKAASEELISALAFELPRLTAGSRSRGPLDCVPVAEVDRLMRLASQHVADPHSMVAVLSLHRADGLPRLAMNHKRAPDNLNYVLTGDGYFRSAVAAYLSTVAEAARALAAIKP